MRQRVVRHVVVVDQIAIQRGDIVAGRSVFQPNRVVHAGIVHQRIQASELFHGLLNCLLAGLRRRQFHGDQATRSILQQFGL